MTDHPLLRTVKPEHRFYLQDGTSIAGLKELSKKIGSLPETMYKHHVNFAKNDFHSWMSHVIKDTHLSKEIKDVKDQKKMAMLVAKRVSELEGRDARREISQAVAQAQMTATAVSAQAESKPVSKAVTSDTHKTGLMITFDKLSKIENAPKPKAPAESGWVQLKALDHTPKTGRTKIPAVGIKKPAAKKEEIKKEMMSAPAKENKTARRTKSRVKPSKVIVADRHADAYSDLDSSRPLHLNHIIHQHHYIDAHESHKSCMRCGMMEFGIGLAVGIVATLMMAKAFF